MKSKTLVRAKFTVAKTTVLISTALVLLMISIFPASSSPEARTVSASTGNVNLAGVATIRVDYSLYINVKCPTQAVRGSVTNWQATTKNGRAAIEIDVAGQTFSKTFSLALGRNVNLDVTTGVKAFFFVTASNTIEVSGPATSNASALDFSSEGTKNLHISISDQAEIGDTVSVSMPFFATISVGLKIDLVILKREIASTKLGTFSMSPTISESISIVEQITQEFVFNLKGNTMVWLFAVSVFGSAIGASYYMKRKGRPKIELVQGMVGILGGLIVLVCLFLPWITVEGRHVPGLEMGEVFAQLINVQILTAITLFILLFALLIILGGFLHIGGYRIGKEIITTASGLTLFLTVIIALSLGAVPLEELPLSLEANLWICIFGAILGLIGSKLVRTQTKMES